jgi:hypothetical protein
MLSRVRILSFFSAHLLFRSSFRTQNRPSDAVGTIFADCSPAQNRTSASTHTTPTHLQPLIGEKYKSTLFSVFRSRTDTVDVQKLEFRSLG